MSISVPWGSEELQFDLPAGWRLSGVVEPATPVSLDDVDKELIRVLRQPTGSKPLADICRGSKSVAVVVDDLSRPTPAHLFMDSLLDEITGAGVSEEDITLVTGLGTHRAMPVEEMEQKVGGAALERVKWVNHDCRDDSQLVRIGRTKRGTAIEVNRVVATSDVAVLVGTIEPHAHASFGGGYKNILPGVAGIRTIGHNHMLVATPRTFSMVGWQPEDNPMRLDIEEAGQMLEGTCFAVNTILSSEKKVAKIVAGDPVRAHREGVEFSRKLYGIPVESMVDVVITGSHPMDHDLRQGVKSVANTFMAAKKGGLVIAAMRCQGGAGDMSVPRLKVPSSQAVIRMMARSLIPVVKYLPFGIPLEERFYMYTALRTALRNRINIYAPEIPLEARRRLGRFFALGTFQEALEEAAAQYPDAEVLVFPKGGVTYPIVEK